MKNAMVFVVKNGSSAKSMSDLSDKVIAVQNGIKLIPVAASGVDKDTESLLRFFAIVTGVTRTGESEEIVNHGVYVRRLTWFIDANGNGQLDENEECTPENGLTADGKFLGGKTYSVYFELAVTEGMGRLNNEAFTLKVNDLEVPINTTAAQGVYTFPETEIVGYGVSGNVESFNSDTDPVTIQLIWSRATTPPARSPCSPRENCSSWPSPGPWPPIPPSCYWTSSPPIWTWRPSGESWTPCKRRLRAALSSPSPTGCTGRRAGSRFISDA